MKKPNSYTSIDGRDLRYYSGDCVCSQRVYFNKILPAYMELFALYRASEWDVVKNYCKKYNIRVALEDYNRSYMRIVFD